MKTLIKILCLSVFWFSCEETIPGCTDDTACNFSSSANSDDNSCFYSEDWEDQCGVCDLTPSNDNTTCEQDECGIWGGDGIDVDSDGICDDVDDCVGQYDECGVCNGDGVDEDEDGICDDIDDCVGTYDECGVCNGDGSSCAPIVSDLIIDNNGAFTIDIVDLNQDESVDFAVLPIDEFGDQIINGLTIKFEILDNSPGYLSSSSVVVGSSGAQQTFYISPSSNLEDGAFNFNLVTKIRTYVESNPSVNDTINIFYADGNLQTENEILNILSANPSTISIGEESLITVSLTGTLNGQSGVGIPNQYIHFQSSFPENGPDGSIDFGEMNPEYAQTDSLGLSYSIFTTQDQTGFVRITATYDDLQAETFIEVLP